MLTYIIIVIIFLIGYIKDYKYSHLRIFSFDVYLKKPFFMIL